MKTKHLWVVMKAHTWDSVVAEDGTKLNISKDSPQRFLPVFESEAKAKKWAGKGSHIMQVTVEDNPQ